MGERLRDRLRRAFKSPGVRLRWFRKSRRIEKSRNVVSRERSDRDLAEIFGWLVASRENRFPSRADPED